MERSHFYFKVIKPHKLYFSSAIELSEANQRYVASGLFFAGIDLRNNFLAHTHTLEMITKILTCNKDI